MERAQLGIMDRRPTPHLVRKRRQREKRGSGWVHWVHRRLRKKHRRNRNFRVLWVDVEKSWTQSMQRASACLQDLAARARQRTDAVDALRFSLNTPHAHSPSTSDEHV